MKPFITLPILSFNGGTHFSISAKNVFGILLIVFSNIVEFSYGQKQVVLTNPSSLLQEAPDFDWKMPKRFTTKRVWVDNYYQVGYGYELGSYSYLPEYVNPKNWEVMFFVTKGFRSKNHQNVKQDWKIVDENGQEIVRTHQNAANLSPSTNKNRTQKRETEVIVVPTNAGNAYYKTNLPKLGIYNVTLTLTDGAGNQITKTKQVLIKDYLIVSIGDSFSSGEGNPDVDGVTDDEILCEKFTTMSMGKEIDMKKYPVWLEPKAHRSLKSGSAKAAELLENADPHTSVTFITFACSGAKITQGLLSPQHTAWQQKGQIDEVKAAVGNRKIDALVMSIGINDLLLETGISGLIISAANPLPPQFQDSNELKNAFSQLEKLPQLYTRLNQKINSSLNVSSIFLYEIPINMFRDKDNNPTEGCGILKYIEKQDAIIIDRIGVDLNRIAQASSGQHGWNYLSGIVEAFRGHGYCESPQDSWYRAGQTSCKCQGDFNGTIHPNEAGHTKIGSILFERLKSKLSRQNELELLNVLAR